MDITKCNAPEVGICCVDDWYSYCCLIPNRIHINGEIFLEKDKCENCTIYNGYNLYNKNNGIQYLYIMLHNYCNAKCDMCDMCIKENKKYITKYKEILHDKNLNSVQKVVIHGGETFLLEKELLELIDFLSQKIKNKYANWYIITNGTIYNENILKTLNKLNFNIIFSIDGFKNHNNMVRKGCDYNLIKNNWFLIKKNFKNCFLSINYTLHINNVNWFFEDIKNMSIDLETKNISINYVTYPANISLLSLNKEDKKINNYLKDVIKFKKYLKWVNLNEDITKKILIKILEMNIK